MSKLITYPYIGKAVGRSMEGVLKTALQFPERWLLRSTQRADQSEQKKLLDEIRAVCMQVRIVQHRFDQICDPDLMDACIYEMEALHARYRYLLGQAKLRGITETPFTP